MDVFQDETEKMNDLLCEKMANELDDLIEGEKQKPSEEVVKDAYEITYKREIFYSFDFDVAGNIPLSYDEAKALYRKEKPLDYLYREWLEYDGSVISEVENSNSYAVQKAVVDDRRHIQNRNER